jgi:hypothetical protein
MKTPEERQTKHIACHINDLTLKDWDAARRADSIDPDAPDKWSVWIREKVDMALSHDLLQSVTPDASTIEVQELQRENEALKKRMAVLEGREIGASFNRVIEILQGTGYVDFNVIVQRLIDTEAQAAYQALQGLAAQYIVECDPVSCKKWRLRS